jgi:hypothetical protein
LKALLIDLTTAVAVGLLMFALLFALRANSVLLVVIPIGLAAVWYLAQTARRRRSHHGPK